MNTNQRTNKDEIIKVISITIKDVGCMQYNMYMNE